MYHNSGSRGDSPGYIIRAVQQRSQLTRSVLLSIVRHKVDIPTYNSFTPLTLALFCCTYPEAALPGNR